MNRTELTIAIRELLSTQLFGVLASHGESGLHTTLICFAAADDIHTILFATPRGSRKFRNLAGNGEVSLFVDDRVNARTALDRIHGVEARGTASEICGDERAAYEPLFRAKHPELAGFAKDAALVKIQVKRYDVVYRFQNVVVLILEGAEDAP